MKILLPARHPIGGIRTYLKYTYGKFTSHDYDVTLLFPEDYEHEAEVKLLDNDLSNLNLTMVVAKGKRPLLSLARTIFKYLFNHRWDIIHSQGSSCGIIVSAINLLFRTPHIITFHETFDEQRLKAKVPFLARKIMSFLFSRANALNTVSNDAKHNLVKHFPELSRYLNRIIVIQNGIDVHYFRETVENHDSTQDIQGMHKDTFLIGYLGRYMPEKGFLVLVDAIDQITNTYAHNRELRVLCLGWGAFIREYQAYIRERGLSDYFVFLHFQPDVRWVLRQIDLLAIPSLREAFGLVAIEGLVSGTPIVASDCIGLREVLKGTPARIVASGASHQLADKINEVMNNYRTVRQEFTDFVPHATKRFDVTRSASRLETLIMHIGRCKCRICQLCR